MVVGGSLVAFSSSFFLLHVFQGQYLSAAVNVGFFTLGVGILLLRGDLAGRT